MNWIRIVVAGVVAGFVTNIADFVMHGFILGKTYMRYPVFSQEQANPLLVIECDGEAAEAVDARAAFFSDPEFELAGAARARLLF